MTLTDTELRRAIIDIDAILRHPGAIDDLNENLAGVHRRHNEAQLRQSVGARLRASYLAEVAARVLGIDRDHAEQLAFEHVHGDRARALDVLSVIREAAAKVEQVSTVDTSELLTVNSSSATPKASGLRQRILRQRRGA